jgi:hypothetical protein
MHRQFILLLASQILSPICYVAIPFFAGTVAAVTSLKPNKLVIQLALLAIIFYGSSNSLLTIVFIGPFRKHFLNVIVFPWLKPLLRFMGFKNLFKSGQARVVHITVITRAS